MKVYIVGGSFVDDVWDVAVFSTQAMAEECLKFCQEQDRMSHFSIAEMDVDPPRETWKP